MGLLLEIGAGIVSGNKDGDQLILNIRLVIKLPALY